MKRFFTKAAALCASLGLALVLSAGCGDDHGEEEEHFDSYALCVEGHEEEGFMPADAIHHCHEAEYDGQWDNEWADLDACLNDPNHADLDEALIDDFCNEQF